jgi:transcriptional regulator with GAF, ATPase, and Fis domain
MRMGKFEQADGGTVFLDEIGELPLDAQVKLLRVLQEMEFERIGAGRTVKVDVRIIAATNRDLATEVAEGRFRLDLYYRLNVFPIEVPPLRNRKEDISLLAKSFIDRFCSKTQRKEIGISDHALAMLKSYHWPGNIRELEHLMERQVLMCRGDMIEKVTLPEPAKATAVIATTPTTRSAEQKTLESVETEYIFQVLRDCNGKIGGLGGAAEILGMPATTLHSRLKKLGVKREYYTDSDNSLPAAE